MVDWKMAPVSCVERRSLATFQRKCGLSVKERSTVRMGGMVSPGAQLVNGQAVRDRARTRRGWPVTGPLPRFSCGVLDGRLELRGPVGQAMLTDRTAALPRVEKLDDDLPGVGGRDHLVDQVARGRAVGQGVPLPLLEKRL